MADAPADGGMADPARADVVEEFRSITNLAETEAAERLLEMHAWNLDAAVNAFFRGDFEPPASTPVRREPEPVDNGQTDDPTERPRTEGALADTVRSTVGALAWPFDWLTNAEPEPVDDRAASRMLKSRLERAYDGSLPTTFDGAFHSAADLASGDGRFLLVYLHSDEHEDTDAFVQGVLQDEHVRTFLDGNLVLWAGSCHHREGAILEERLKATTYPFLALMMCHSGRTPGLVNVAIGGNGASPGISAEVIGRLEGTGCLAQEQVMNWLTSSMVSFQTQLDDIRRRQEQRQRDVELRAEQERNFQEALEADQRRQREAEEEQRRIQEEEAQEAQRRAEEEAQQLQREREAQAEMQRKKEEMRPEPAAGPDTTRLRFQFPNGVKLTRRFHSDETVGGLKSFLEVHSEEAGLNIQRVMISSSHPRRDYMDDDEDMQDSGLHPQAALFVRDLDA